MIDFKVRKDDFQKACYFLIISTFSNDEPMAILLEAIKYFNAYNYDKITFKITGNYKKKLHLYSKYSQENNIEFLGFIPLEEYNHLLINSFGVIALTTRDNVQQCAVIEAVSAKVPFISNINSTNCCLFDSEMILTEITSEEIAKSIELFIKNKLTLDKNIIEINKRLQGIWENDFNIIKKELGI